MNPLIFMNNRLAFVDEYIGLYFVMMFCELPAIKFHSAFV